MKTRKITLTNLEVHSFSLSQTQKLKKKKHNKLWNTCSDTKFVATIYLKLLYFFFQVSANVKLFNYLGHKDSITQTRKLNLQT